MVSKSSQDEMLDFSSHNAYLGLSEITWLTTGCGLSKFGKAIEKSRTSYSLYLSKVESPEELAELRNRLKDGQVLGEDDFLDHIRKISSIEFDNKLSLKNILNAGCCQMKIEEELTLSPSKAKASSYARGIVSSMLEKKNTCRRSS